MKTSFVKNYWTWKLLCIKNPLLEYRFVENHHTFTISIKLTLHKIFLFKITRLRFTISGITLLQSILWYLHYWLNVCIDYGWISVLIRVIQIKIENDCHGLSKVPIKPGTDYWVHRRITFDSYVLAAARQSFQTQIMTKIVITTVVSVWQWLTES